MTTRRTLRQKYLGRAGAVSVGLVVILGSLVLLAALAIVLWRGQKPNEPAGKQSLLVYCAASQKAPLTKIAEQYEKESGVAVELQFGGSQTLLANAKVSKMGDLFLPADDSYLKLAEEKQMVGKVWPLAKMHAMLALQKGNPLEIHSIDDLVSKGARLSLANPEAAAIGKLVREALTTSGQWEAAEKLAVVVKPTVTDGVNDVKLGAADAAFMWDCMRPQYPDLELIEMPALTAIVAQISVGQLKHSGHAEAAERFGRYLSASDQGLKIFKDAGYETVEGAPFVNGK